ncbi:hypothetical protein KC19_VG258100 [Ceratodon purpureus]|uniref:Uncharacterized protein n=1 Tax=Ceratodon purpureus TaxID=3225 RepID=A0A8T0HUG0_CERPU|nr:hypothetical protein KC19_VG258100 [Ceratodon purpureus]
MLWLIVYAFFMMNLVITGMAKAKIGDLVNFGWQVPRRCDNSGWPYCLVLCVQTVFRNSYYVSD